MNENLNEKAYDVSNQEDTAITPEDVHEVETCSSDEPVEVVDPPKAIEDEQNPLTDQTIKNISTLMKQVAEMCNVMEATWKSTKQEFSLTDAHMKQLHHFNEQHKKSMPEYLSDEDKEKWDHFNGLDEITEEEVVEIFGEEHPIIGIFHTQTIDRIKSVVNEFFTWLSTLKEYRQIHDAYLKLVETQEEDNIKRLTEVMEKEEDPEKKAAMKASLDLYYRNKYLDFLADEVPEKDIDRLLKAFTDEKKVSYWIRRSEDKLKQLKISTKIIPELAQFEKRFLDEKYHKASNMLLLHFMQSIIYCDCGDKKDQSRRKVICMVLMLDNIIRNTVDEETRKRVLNNVMKFEDQFLDRVPTTKEG